MKATEHTYTSLQEAYDYFNRELFSNDLPDCLITLNTAIRKAFGFYYHDKFAERGSEQKVDEIALNPEAFEGRTDLEIISTLVHEMCHVWQQHYGKPSRNGYHNREWASKMLEVGLVPSSTGAEGGKLTGQRMSHYVDPAGRFQALFDDYFRDRVLIRYDGQRNAGGEKKQANKVKYTCPSCGINAWGKDGLAIVCEACEERLERAA